MANYKSYTGSPDIFDSAGKWISQDQAQTLGLFSSTPGQINPSLVDTVGTTRPDLKVESDYARLSQKDIGWTEQINPMGENSGTGLVTGSNGIAGAVDGLNKDIAGLDIPAPTTPPPYQDPYKDANGQSTTNSLGKRYNYQTKQWDDPEPIAPAFPTAPVEGQYTPEQQARIDAEGARVSAQYDPLIRKAEDAKTQGMGKATVGAGEIGGFMNSQFAGLAAGQASNGGDWIGTGGELMRIQSEYDGNIKDLNIQKQQAIEAAKNSMKSFIESGKQQDFQNAQVNYKNAVEKNEAITAAANAKAKAIADLQKLTFDLNVPLAQAGENIQSWVTDQITKYPSIATKITPTMTGQQIGALISTSPEYLAAFQKALAGSYGSGIIGEYQFALDSGWTGKGDQSTWFTQYQNEDANRKQSIARAGVGGTVGERNNSKYSAQFALAQPVLQASKNGGEFYDGNVYRQLRSDFGTKYGVAEPFDEVFGNDLSPKDRAKYGIGKAVGVDADATTTSGRPKDE